MIKTVYELEVAMNRKKYQYLPNYKQCDMHDQEVRVSIVSGMQFYFKSLITS